ncbi:MAG TPA: TonB-dependent receptor [Burkholderiales bacterium]
MLRTKNANSIRRWSLACSGALLVCAAAHGADDERRAPTVLDTVNVVGSREAAEAVPGSAHYVGEEAIRTQSYDDINRVLRQVPGVYVREEDGFGLFPNISLRGVDTSRSSKVTIMEDGVPSAPAPYAAPAAYYSPTVGRMSAVEVLKGTSQIKYGPHITGGVINYLSTPIPREQRTYLKTLTGSENELRTHAFAGNTVDTENGRFGYLVEGYFRRTDGFKHIDLAPDFRDGDDTGFHRAEPMVKLAWEPNTTMYQRFEFKIGHTDMEANETYLGLSEADFRADPYRRYSASRFDNIDTEQDRTYLRYFASPTDDVDLATTVYYNKFARAWYKLNDIRNVGGVAGTVNLSTALAAGGDALACLKGQIDCELRVRNNDRTYYARGVEQLATVRFGGAEVQHELTAGIRYHHDQEERFQQDDIYTQAANGAITNFTPGAPGSQDNRIEEVKALAAFVQDRITVGKWQFLPGIRLERLDYELLNRNSGVSGESSLSLAGGSFGVIYDWSPEWKLFGGVHRGFSPPSAGGRINNGLSEETSLGFELGARYTDRRRAFSAEVVGFYTRFDDLIVVSNIGGTGTGLDENFGEVLSYGAEVALSYDAGVANGWSVRNPYFLALTYTNAEQQNDARSTNPESIFSFGAKGNKVPYVPEWQLSAGTGIEAANWGVSAVVTYVDDTFTSASNTTEQVNGNGDPDARFGKTDSYTIVDLTGHYRLQKGARALAGVHNLFDKEYIVSRQPHGPRPGQPRFVYVGLEIDL